MVRVPSGVSMVAVAVWCVSGPSIGSPSCVLRGPFTDRASGPVFDRSSRIVGPGATTEDRRRVLPRVEVVGPSSTRGPKVAAGVVRVLVRDPAPDRAGHAAGARTWVLRALAGTAGPKRGSGPVGGNRSP